MAVRNHDKQRAIFLSDCGSNYMSADFSRMLRGHAIRQTVGRTGICYDNAMPESFFAALKDRMLILDRRQLHRAVTEYVDHHTPAAPVPGSSRTLENTLPTRGETTRSAPHTVATVYVHSPSWSARS
jgi:hypothetical protein